MTPQAPQRTPLHKNRRSYARAVMNGKTLNFENPAAYLAYWPINHEFLSGDFLLCSLNPSPHLILRAHQYLILHAWRELCKIVRVAADPNNQILIPFRIFASRAKRFIIDDVDLGLKASTVKVGQDQIAQALPGARRIHERSAELHIEGKSTKHGAMVP